MSQGQANCADVIATVRDWAERASYQRTVDESFGLRMVDGARVELSGSGGGDIRDHQRLPQHAREHLELADRVDQRRAILGSFPGDRAVFGHWAPGRVFRALPLRLVSVAVRRCGTYG